MPSASSKPENKASSEAPGVMGSILTTVEKRIRNLEKRRGKLVTYKEKAKKGDVLEPEQEAAVAKFDVVEQNLEFAKELLKQFQGIQAETEKNSKKHQKQEQKDRQKKEVSRMEEVLRLQHLLDNLGPVEVRADFKEGKRGAVKLTEENLVQLDGLYQMISPSMEKEEPFAEQVNSSAANIVSFLDGREKEVVGTTYKNLKDMVDKIHSCGYFEQKNDTEENQESEGQSQGDVEAKEYVVVESDDVPEANSSEVASSLPPEVTPVPTQMMPQHPQQPSQPDLSSQYTDTGLQVDHSVKQDAYYAGNTVATGQEHLPDMGQHKFDFLQESEIEVDASQVQHIDPAVVTAHKMAPGLASDTTPYLTSDNHPAMAGQPTQDGLDPSMLQDNNQYRGPTQTPSTGGMDGASYNMNYSQTHISQTLSASNSQQQAAYGLEPANPLGQSLGMDTASLGGVEVPRAIPMPSQTADATQQSLGQVKDSQEKKPFLNPDAAIFHAKYTQPSTVQHQSFASSVANTVDADKAAFDQGSYQNDFQSNTFGQPPTNQWSSGNNKGGQYRGRGGYPRGGRGSAPNGYNNRSGRGGGGQWNNSRGGGGMGYNNRGNTRGMSRGGPRGGSSRGGSRGGGNGGFGRPSGGPNQHLQATA